MKYFFKKNIIAIVIAIAIIIINAAINITSQNVYGTSTFVFDAFNIDAKVYDNGDIKIKETITVTFDRDSNGEFWRDIVTDKNSNGVKKNVSLFDYSSFIMKIYSPKMDLLYDSSTDIKYDKNVVLVGYSWENDKDAYGDRITFEGYDNNGECAYSYVRTSAYPTRIYEFEYILQGFATCYQDIAEINSNFFDPIDSVKITNVNVNIEFLGLSTQNDNNLEVFTHKSTVRDLDITSNKVTYKIDKIMPGDAIEVRVLFPISGVSSIRDNNYVNEKGYEKLKSEENKIASADIFAFKYGNIIVIIVFIVLAVMYAFIMRKAYLKFDKEFESEFKEEYLNELPMKYPPAVVGFLVKFKDLNRDDLTATLMDLIRKGYIEVDYLTHSLTDTDVNYTLIYHREKNQSGLLDFEKYTLEWFFDVIGKGSNTLTFDQIDEFTSKGKNAERYIRCNERWNTLTKKHSMSYKFFDESVSSRAKSVYGTFVGVIFIIGLLSMFYSYATDYYIAALTYLSTIVLAGGIIGASYLATIKRRTKNGNEDYAKWMAFKRYLSDFGNLKDYPIPSLIIWEEFLVYATTFGIAELVSEQLSLRFKDTELLDSPTYKMTTFNRYMYVRMNRCYINAHTSYASYQAKRVGSSAGGSRFGGGSSFGGGGGGARGR